MIKIVYKEEDKNSTLIISALASLMVFLLIIFNNPLLYIGMALPIVVFLFVGMWKPTEWYSAMLIGFVAGYLLTFAVVIFGVLAS